MLVRDEVENAVRLQACGYQLLKWLEKALRDGFIARGRERVDGQVVLTPFSHGFARIEDGSSADSGSPLHLQGACSQPQPISRTPAFSAFSQYSLQYLSSPSTSQSHTPCAHLLFSAIQLPCLPDYSFFDSSLMLEP